MKPRRDDSKGAPAAEVNDSQQILGSLSGKPEKATAHPEDDHGGSQLVLSRWLEALRRESPNLPQPIAVAMTEGAMRGPLGQSLCRIEAGLMEIENASLDHLTGSEVRVLTAILHALTDTATRLEGEVAQLYTARTH